MIDDASAMLAIRIVSICLLAWYFSRDDKSVKSR
jgi:hypothetical protein